MPINRSRSVDPRTAEIRLASAKRSPQTALPTLFTKPPAHTFASGATQHLGCRPSLRLMVRTYIRKGGHGGDRCKAGLPAGYWQEKGLLAGEGWPRRSSRSNGCRQRRKNCLRKRQQRRRRPTAGSNGPSTEMSSSRPAINCKQCNHARLVSLADSTQMKTQRVLVDGSRVLRRAV